MESGESGSEFELEHSASAREGEDGSRSALHGTGIGKWKALPLNSKRVTTLYLKRMAGVLELPTSGSADQLRQIVDAKLDEMHKEPQNVQVIVYSGDEGAPVQLELQDEDGTFLEVPPEDPHGPLLEGDEEESDSEGLAKALRDATAESTALKAEVSMLHEQLGRAKEKIKSM